MATFASFDIAEAAIPGYATAASGGAYLLLNQKLWSWNPNSSRPEPKNYVELEPEVSRGQGQGKQVSNLPAWVSWTNNIIGSGAYGATAVGGSAGMLKGYRMRYYSNAWRGNQYIKTYSLTRTGTGVGYGTSFLGVGIGAVNFALSDKSWGDYGALGVSLLSSGLTLSGVTAPIGIGIGFIDVMGGLNGFYEGLDANQQLYNTAGGVIFPINGIPTYIQIK